MSPSVSKTTLAILANSILILITFGLNNEALAQQNPKIDSIARAVERHTNDSLKILSEIALSREIHRRAHDSKREYKYAQAAVDRALELKDSALYARALDNLGLLYRYHQQYDQALAFHSRAYELIKDKDVPPLHKMIVANNAGVAGRYNHNYDTAFYYYMEALKIAEAENNLKNIAISSNGIGNTLSNIPGREDEALPYFEDSLEAHEQMDNSLGVAMNMLSIAGYYIDRGDYEVARDYLDKLLKLNEERSDLFGLAITNEFKGISYLKEEKNLDKAISFFERSFSQFDSLSNRHKKTELLVHLGDTYFKKDQFDNAEIYYLQSLELSKKIKDLGLISINAQNLSKISEKRNDYKSALAYFRLAETYEDSLDLIDQNIKIEGLKQEYDLEKKENQIRLLEKNKALQQATLDNQKQKLERRRIISIFLGIGLISILIIFLLQYRNYRTRKISAARISQAEKEKLNTIYERNLAQAEILVTRLRVNPHFLFNSLNAITYLVQSEQNDKAIQYLEIFSHYTRMVLETSKQHLIPLAQELELAEHYLSLEENRFSQDFDFRIIGNEPEKIEEVFIPPLLLQPFLENAIWHGLLASSKKSKILTISIKHNDGTTQIEIDDNGAGRRKEETKSKIKTHKSMGMQIIKERIELYNKTYSGKISFRIIDKKNKEGDPTGTRIVVELQNTVENFPYYKNTFSEAT